MIQESIDICKLELQFKTALIFIKDIFWGLVNKAPLKHIISGMGFSYIVISKFIESIIKEHKKLGVFKSWRLKMLLILLNNETILP